MNRIVKRGLAATTLAGALLVASPAVAMADQLIYQGPSEDGRGHNYVHSGTGEVVFAFRYLGQSVEICVQ